LQLNPYGTSCRARLSHFILKPRKPAHIKCAFQKNIPKGPVILNLKSLCRNNYLETQESDEKFSVIVRIGPTSLAVDNEPGTLHNFVYCLFFILTFQYIMTTGEIISYKKKLITIIIYYSMFITTILLYIAT
jgi:hypothetical membrane protein